ncbi:MAG: peptide chain release factor N(5)-glutamine methyltransferase [Thermodesulfatator sp.]|nr:MAG: peptide chain release factor N(5)-glutamine methyltransferase [Thermodesulfatator sp.]
MSLTIHQALERAEKILGKNSRLDIQVLLCHCLNKDKTFLLAHPEYRLDEKEQSSFFSLINRRSLGEPVAYLTGYREFWSRPFICSPSCLIPRPETELVVEAAIKFFDDRGKIPARILDLGTGTGCIGISLALEWKDALTILTDIDSTALAVARQNALRLAGNKARICFICCDWFRGLSESKNFDLITVNPPYIGLHEKHILPRDVVHFEPHTALFSPKDGLAQLEHIFSVAHKFLNAGGVIISEIGWQQADHVLKFIGETRYYKKSYAMKDLAGNKRVIVAQI